MGKKGFTLVELLVVIAIIALLMGILMPALARVRVIAYRMVCGTNLAGIGKAIMLYAGDAREEYPMPGITKMATWVQSGQVSNWQDSSNGGPPMVYMTTGAAGDPGAGTIGSVFYLLVKYEDTSVKQFNCKGDSGVKTFKLSDCPTTILDDLTKAWDFGTQPGKYCSYSYHMPFSLSGTGTSGSQGFAINSNSPPASPLAADRNPTLDGNAQSYLAGGTNGGAALETGKLTPCARWGTGTPARNEYMDPDLVYNSFAHQREGQNVLFNDAHVRFEKQANVGVDNDNIWQKWPGTTIPTLTSEREACGEFPTLPTGSNAYDTYISPVGIGDAFLINEHQNSGATCI
jgi:prepilin-type N-terminal cleavage/methylation domain-containing protein